MYRICPCLEEVVVLGTVHVEDNTRQALDIIGDRTFGRPGKSTVKRACEPTSILGKD